MRLLLVLAVSLTLVPAAGAWTRLPLLDQVASEIAGRPVEVRCMHQDEWAPPNPTWLAYTWFNGDGSPAYVALSPQVCWSLILLAVDPDKKLGAHMLSSGNAKAVWEQGSAVLLLAHEAVHMTGVRDESNAECAALSHTDRVILRFGATSRIDQLRTDVQAAHALAPPEYKRAC